MKDYHSQKIQYLSNRVSALETPRRSVNEVFHTEHLGEILGLIQAIRKIVNADELLIPIFDRYDIDEEFTIPSPFVYFEELEKMGTDKNTQAIPYSDRSTLTTTSRVMWLSRLVTELKPFMEADEFETMWFLFERYVVEFVSSFQHD